MTSEFPIAPPDASSWAATLLMIGLTAALCGCTTLPPQIHSTTQVHAVGLKSDDLQKAGLAFITPSTATGQEEDKQALALAFANKLIELRPSIHSVSLPETLSAINRSGMTAEYRRMFEDYSRTGIFDRDMLRKVAKVTGVRYLAQLKLAGFKQESKSRWGALGFRVLETKLSDIRLFLQIWDSQDGSIVWEGVDELTYSQDTVLDDAVTFRTAVEETAKSLIARLPGSGVAAGIAPSSNSPEEKRAPPAPVFQSLSDSFSFGRVTSDSAAP